MSCFHNIINDEDLLKILNLLILFVLDEAYIEFSVMRSRMEWVRKHENLIVIRTFSKREGMLNGEEAWNVGFPINIIATLPCMIHG